MIIPGGMGDDTNYFLLIILILTLPSRGLLVILIPLISYFDDSEELSASISSVF